MWWYEGDWGWGAWLVMTAGILAFWGLVLWAMLALVRNNAGDGALREITPEQLLAEGFARGEIDEEDYRRRLAALRDSHTSSPVPTGDPS